jgi:hypothetical protein
MRPGKRACAGFDSFYSFIFVIRSRDRPVNLFSFILAVVGVAMRKKAVFLAPERDGSPFLECRQMPASSFTEAVAAGAFDTNRVGRDLTRSE